MKEKFDQLSFKFSKVTTTTYSTSFSIGITFLDSQFRQPIYNIYGFVRFADEIVDSFHGYDKRNLLSKFKEDAYEAINDGISLNPILNSFAQTVNKYNIDFELINAFLDSMEMDLHKQEYDKTIYDQYILGSAEVVGLMCLRVFVNGDTNLYAQLKPYAMKLGAAFQKVNFLRDMKDDFNGLGRTYFPAFSGGGFSDNQKSIIEEEIEKDFVIALQGIKLLPAGSRRGVYLAYFYYKNLFNRIKRFPMERIMNERVRIPNFYKFILMLISFCRHQLNIL
jgi:phytoene synthase